MLAHLQVMYTSPFLAFPYLPFLNTIFIIVLVLMIYSDKVEDTTQFEKEIDSWGKPK